MNTKIGSISYRPSPAVRRWLSDNGVAIAAGIVGGVAAALIARRLLRQ